MNALKAATGIAIGLLLTAHSAIAGSVARSTHAAVVSDSPHATQTGLAVLRAGGNAIDAAVAIAFVLGVVHPHSGTVGGGGFLMFYEAEKGAVWSLDFRETAPSTAAKGNGAATSAGVPGTIAGLHAMHTRFGSRSWRELLQPAIGLARNGVRIEPSLRGVLTPAVAQTLNVAAKGASELRQPKMALFLERLAAHGADDFYRGRLADQFVSDVRKSGSSISQRDLKNYEAVWRAPIRIRFRGDDVYAPPPPSGSGVVIAQLLAILEESSLSRSLDGAGGLHLFAEASRRAFIDRDRFVADPSTSRIAYRELLSPERAAMWRASIRPQRVTPTASLGVPEAIAERAHTTHFAIVDARGNAAAVTVSLGGDFGSGLLVPSGGFFLNDALASFSAGGVNAGAPGKRPLSSACPTIVMRSGKPYLLLGGAGGSSIPTTIAQIYLRHLSGQEVSRAVAEPRYHQGSLPDLIEYEAKAPSGVIESLNEMGHAVALRPSIGSAHVMLISGDGILSIADPRSNGAAGGF